MTIPIPPDTTVRGDGSVLDARGRCIGYADPADPAQGMVPVTAEQHRHVGHHAGPGYATREEEAAALAAERARRARDGRG